MKKYDLILWGATSFAGAIVAKYLNKQNELNNNFIWAIAGRNQNKLNLLKSELDLKDYDLDILIADSNNKESLVNLVKQTKVVISTVGPYMKYGEYLVAACAEVGTNYCDLTGELPFVRAMQDLYSNKAIETGSKIVNCCGVDSIPSDLGVFYLNNLLLEKYNSSLNLAKCYVKKFKGGFSGGTIDSIINIIETAKDDTELQKIFKNPYALCLPQDRQGIKQPNIATYYYDKELKKWFTPFLMASINTRIVHASNSRLGYPYGKDFIYSEYMQVKSYTKALLGYLFLGLGFTLLTYKSTRWLLKKLFLPKAGSGPSAQEQKNGSFVFELFGKTKDNNSIKVQVTGDEDPGYGASAKMLAETGLCLALDIDDNKGGFYTPASALGSKLIKRLKDHADIDFVVCESN